MLLQNSFEGGTSGSAITAAGSGGASGNAFDAVAGASPPQWSNSHAAHGSLGMAMQGIGEVEWTSSVGTPTTLYGRAYVLYTSLPASIVSIAAGLTPTSAGTRQLSVRLSTSGKITNLCKSGTVVTSTTTLSASTWYRVEFKMVAVPSGTCTIDCTIYLGDSTTATEVMTQATGTGVSTDTSVNAVWFGSANTIAANIVFLDDIQVNDSGFPGPATVSTPRTRVYGLPFAPSRTQPMVGWR